MQWLRDAQHFHPRLESLYPALWETCEEFGESYPFQTLKSMVNLSTLNTSFSGSPLIENSFSGWRLPWATSKREAKKLWCRLRRKVIVLLNSGKQEKGDRNQTTASKFCQNRSFIILTQFQLKNIDLASRINRWQLSLQMNLKKWDLKIAFSYWDFPKGELANITLIIHDQDFSVQYIEVDPSRREQPGYDQLCAKYGKSVEYEVWQNRSKLCSPTILKCVPEKKKADTTNQLCEKY